MAVAATVVLAQSPLTVAGTNSISAAQYIELEKGHLNTCQPSGALPRGTSAIRIGIEGRSFSPAVTVKILKGPHVLKEGQQVAGRGATPTVTVHVNHLTQAVNGAQICTTVTPTGETLRFYGKPKRSPASNANQLQNAELHMEYLRPRSKSWWSSASSIAYHMGLGHTPSGAWVVFLVLALILAVIIIASRLTLEELR